MYKISDEYKNVIENKTSLSPKCKIIVDGIEYTSKVIKTFPKIKHKSEKIFGGFPAKTCEFEIYDLDNSLNFVNKEIFVYKGLIINNKVEYIPQGVFIPKAENITTNISQKTIQLKDVQDKTRFFDEQYVSNLDWTTTHKGLEIVQEICTKLAIELANKTFNWANFNFKRPNFNEKITYREVISRLAEIGGSIAFINRDGKLEIKSQTPTGNTISRKRYTNPTREDQIGPYNTIVLGREGINNDIVYPETIKEDRVEFKILDNPFVDLYREEMIEEVAKYIIGKSIIPFSLTDFVDGFYYDLNDTLEIIDRTGKTFTGVILNYESTSRIKSNISAEIQESTPTNYNLAGSQKQLLGQVKLDVDHANKRIDGLVSDVSNNTEKVTQLEATTNGLKNSVSTVEKDLATTNSNLEQTNKNVDGLSSKIDGVSADFKEFKDNEYVQSIENLQDQIDGAIQFWNGSAIPTINNYPANEWTTENDRNNHRADIYTVIEDVNGELKQGKSYRFDKVNGVWQWIELTDNELSAVQALAQQALDKSNKNSDDIGFLNKKASEFEQTDSEIKASVDELNNRYEQDITIDKKVEGYPIVVENAGAYNVEELKVYGNSEQDTRSGKNKINISKYLFANYHGLQNILNEDGSVTTTGKPTTDYSGIINGYIINDELENGETYTFSQKNANSKLYCQMNIKDNDTGTFTHIGLNSNTINQKSFVVDKSKYTYYMNIQTGPMTSWGDENLTITNFYQLEKGSLATDFEKYGVMPSPEYPSEIRNVEPIENLFDYNSNNVYANFQGLKSVINEDGSITTTGKPTNSYTSVTKLINITDILKDGETYTLSQKKLNNKLYLQVSADPIDGNNTEHYTTINGTRTFIVDKSKFKNYALNIQTNTLDIWGDEELTITNFYQLEKGDKAHEPVPYGHWLKGKITGRNILNIPNDEITLIKSSKRTVNIYPITPLILEKGTYTISFPDLVLQNNKNDIAVDLVGSNYNNLVIKDNKATFIIDNKVTIKYLYIFINRNDNDEATATFSQIQIEVGDTATEYEPYKEKEFLYPMDKENLFDNEIEHGSLNNTTGDSSSITDLCIRSKNFIEVKSNKDYTIFNNKNYHNYIYEYDNSKKFIKYTANSNNPFVFKSSENTKYIKFRTISDSQENDLTTKWVIYEGTSSLPYHELSKIEDTKDDLEFISGVLNKKIGVFVADGTENWVCGKTISEQSIWAYIHTNEFEKKSLPIKINAKILCNILPYTDLGIRNYHYRDGNSIYGYSDKSAPFIITTNKVGTVNEWKQYLNDLYNAGTPLIFYYELETPEKIQLNPINIDLFKGYNRITLEDKYGIVEEAEMTYLTDSKLNGKYVKHSEFDMTSKAIKESVEETKTAVDEMSKSIQLFSVDLEVYNLTIPVDENNKPLETSNFVIKHYSYFKGTQIKVKPTITSQISGLTATATDENIQISVNKATSISNLSNELEILFSYTEEEAHVIYKKLIITLSQKGIDGKDGAPGENGKAGNGINSITYYYAVTSNQTQPSASDITGTTIPTLSSTNKYLWQKEVIDFSDSSVEDKTTIILLAVYGDTGLKGDKGDKGDNGKDGTNGTNGTSITIKSTSITYQASSSGTDIPTSTWETSIPPVQNGQYLWTKTVVNYSDGTSTTSYSVAYKGTNGAKGDKGEKGEQGIQGPKGADGTSTYFYVKYSDNANGNPMYDTPKSTTKYMGVSSTTSSSAPTNYSAYIWSQIKGNDGINGTPGQKGADGKTPYLHIKYSQDGINFVPADEEAGYGLGEKPSSWLGKYVDYTEADSTHFDDYEWYKFTESIDGTLTNLQNQINDTATQSNNNYQELNDKLNNKADTSSVAEVKNKVQDIITSTERTTTIIEEIQKNGVTQVKTETNFTFDKDGLNLDKTGANTASKLDEAGFEVKDKTGDKEESLSYNGFVDEEMALKSELLKKYLGTTVNYARNSLVEQWLSFSNWRLEEVDDSIFGRGIGFFKTGD